MLMFIMLSVVMLGAALFYCYCYAECRNAECHYGACRCAECHHAECHGAH